MDFTLHLAPIDTLSCNRRIPPSPLRPNMAVKNKVWRRWTAKYSRIYVPYPRYSCGLRPARVLEEDNDHCRNSPPVTDVNKKSLCIIIDGELG